MSWRFVDWPLRAKMVAFLVATSLLPLGVAAYVDTKEAYEGMKSSLRDLLEARGDQIVRELDGFNRAYGRAANRIAVFRNVKAFCAAGPTPNPTRAAEASDILAAFPASDPGVRGVALLDRGGRVMLGTEPPRVGVNVSNPSDLDAALRGNSVISDVFIAETQAGEAPTIGYFAPVIGPEGQTACVVALWVRAAAMWTALRESNALAGPNSFAVLFDQRGVRIGHTMGDEIVFHPGAPLDDSVVDELVAERRFGARTRALLEDVRASPEQFDRARAAAPGTAMFRGFAPFNRTWNYGVARRFETAPWTIFYLVPEAAFDAKLARLGLEKTLLAAAIMAAAAGVGAVLSATLLDPLRALLKSTDAIAGGDLTARVRRRGADEIGQLSESFNAMAGRIQLQSIGLRRTRDELEIRVQERTTDLQKEVAERKRAEAARERLAAIVESSEDAIVGKTLDGVITSWNAGAARLLGYSSAEAVGQPMLMIVPDRLHDERQIIEQIRRHERSNHLETRRRKKDGAEVDVSVIVSPIRDAGGEIVGESEIARDITELKLRDAELTRSNAALEQYAQIASHDLQEPLRMVAAFTELLAQRYHGKLDETADKYIHLAADGAKRMQTLVAELLAYSRVGSQGKPLARVESEQALGRVVSSLGLLIRDSGASVEYGSLPAVMADEGQLCQLFQNLVANAIKFRSEAPPHIVVKAVPRDGGWLFSVADNGIGLDMRHAERIFQMFQRLRERDKVEGSGFGLAIAKRIVERHGGRIWVEARPGAGTTFYFTLPSVQESSDVGRLQLPAA